MSELTVQEMKKILSEEDTATLCMANGDVPYAVPVSYAYIDEKIIFHCALKGKKLDFIKKNPHVCMVVDRHPDRMKPHHPEGKCKYRFESVICEGRARIIDSVEERYQYLLKFLKYFNVRLSVSDDKPLLPEAAEKCGVVIIEIIEMSGRKKD